MNELQTEWHSYLVNSPLWLYICVVHNLSDSGVCFVNWCNSTCPGTPLFDGGWGWSEGTVWDSSCTQRAVHSRLSPPPGSCNTDSYWSHSGSWDMWPAPLLDARQQAGGWSSLRTSGAHLYTVKWEHIFTELKHFHAKHNVCVLLKFSINVLFLLWWNFRILHISEAYWVPSHCEVIR